MVPYFGYGNITASSAPAESEFSDLKTKVFRNMNLPIRLDDLIFNHIKTMEGSMKLAAADYQHNHSTIDSYEQNVSTDQIIDTDTTCKPQINNTSHQLSNEYFEKINLHENYTKEYEYYNTDPYELDNYEDTHNKQHGDENNYGYTSLTNEQSVFTDKSNDDSIFKTKTNNEYCERSNECFEKIKSHENYMEDKECHSII